MLVLMPLAFVNVRAPVGGALHATDASPTGAGSCTAVQLKRARGAPNPNDILCTSCRKDMGEIIGLAEEFDCPRNCGQRSCSVECHLRHQSRCELKELPTVVVSERWSGLVTFFISLPMRFPQQMRQKKTKVLKSLLSAT